MLTSVELALCGTRGMAQHVVCLGVCFLLGRECSMADTNATLNVTLGVVDMWRDGDPVRQEVNNCTLTSGRREIIEVSSLLLNETTSLRSLQQVGKFLDEGHDLVFFTQRAFRPHHELLFRREVYENSFHAQEHRTNMSKTGIVLVLNAFPRNESELCGLVDDMIYGREWSSLFNLTMVYAYASTIAAKANYVADLVSNLEWKSLLFIMDKTEAISSWRVLDALSARGIEVFVYNMEAPNVTFGAVLRKIHNEIEPTKVLLSCSKANMEIVFSAVVSYELGLGRKVLRGRHFLWLVLGRLRDRAAIESMARQEDNVAVVMVPGILEDCQPSGSDIPMQQWSEHPVMTLLWKPGGRTLSPVGSLQGLQGENLTSVVFPNTQYGFNMRNFLVSTISYPPFMRQDNVTGNFTGLCMDLLTDLASSLNFTFQMTSPADGEFGVNVGHDNWTGLVGQLHREEVDLVVAPLTVNPDREAVVDFTFPFYHDYTSVILRRPDPNRSKWRTFIDPFKAQVHICIWVSLVLSATIFYIIERANPFYRANRWSNRLGPNDSFWYLYGALLNQGGVSPPDSQAGRTFMSMWWIFCLVVAAIYSGNLIAFLTVTKDKPPFETLEEMVQQSEYKWGLLGGSVWVGVFEKSNTTSYQAVYRRTVEFAKEDKDVLSSNQNAHIEKVKQGGYAYLTDISTIDRVKAESESCDLVKIKEDFLPMSYSLALPENSTLTATFSEQLLKIYESGLMQVWQKRWWSRSTFCKGSLTTETKPINLIDMQSAFYLVGIGITLSSLFLVAEVILRKYREYCDKKKFEVGEVHVREEEGTDRGIDL